jgi:hypothetical protein
MARSGGLDALPATVSGGDLTLVGGTVDESAVDALVVWLADTGAGPWWTFREWTNRMQLVEGLVEGVEELQGDSVRFVWGRWFGAAGDLEVRRDAGRFRWRWVGTGGVRPPPDVAAVETDFFTVPEGAPAPVLRPAGEETALLWDRADGRVANADAKTLSLLPSDGSRLQLRYTAYYDRGVVAAVRYRRIEPVPQSAQGRAAEAEGG